MSWKHLGETFDIHGGGIDLVFPHHENEIAQSRCAFGHDVMANVWMHNGFLQVEGEKMSKSLGNFRHHPRGARRLAGRSGRASRCSRPNYRQPIDWTLASLRESKRELDRWYAVASQYASSEDMVSPEFEAALVRRSQHARSDHASASALFGSQRRRGVRGRAPCVLRPSAWPVPEDLAAWNGWRPASAGIDELQVQRLDQRAHRGAQCEELRGKSDRIRDELVAMGIQIMDGKDPDGETDDGVGGEAMTP